jgi:hypothetical protein
MQHTCTLFSTSPTITKKVTHEGTNSGPAPKNPATRRRSNTPKAEQTGIATITALPVAKPRPASPKWSREIKDLWQAIVDSKVPKQDTDLAFGWVLLDTLHKAVTSPNLATGQLNASLVDGCLAQTARLGVAHADRVRAGVVLRNEEAPDEKKAAIMAHYREILLPEGDGLSNAQP